MPALAAMQIQRLSLTFLHGVKFTIGGAVFKCNPIWLT